MKNVFTALERLSEEVSFEEAYIFGSITKPYQFGDFSDVDIAFKGLDKDKLFFTISFLNRLIGRDISVVIIETAHFKDKILREGIRWKRD
ncbi:MAG: nucleotidyltransferase family protein [Nitrospirota bacterium]